MDTGTSIFIVILIIYFTFQFIIVNKHIDELQKQIEELREQKQEIK